MINLRITPPSIAVILALTPIGSRAEDFTLSDGTEYRGVTVNRADPDGLVVTTESGVIKLEFADLPPAVGAKYGYDEEKAAAFRQAAKSEARQRNLAKVHRALNRIEVLKSAELARGGVTVQGVVTRTLKGGTPIEGAFLDLREYTTPADGKSFVSEPLIIFVEGLIDLADGEAFAGAIYPTGRLLREEEAAFRAYAITPAAAYDRIREKGAKTVEQVVTEDRARWSAR